MVTSRDRVAQAVVVSAAAAVFAVGLFARPTQAFNPQPDPPAFGMVGIVDGQTARVNLANVPSRFEVSPGPCRADLQFFDAQGALLATRRVSVEPGHAESLDYAATFTRGDAIGELPAVQRGEIRGAVNLFVGGVAPGPCRATVEVFDNLNGRTSVLQTQ